MGGGGGGFKVGYTAKCEILIGYPGRKRRYRIFSVMFKVVEARKTQGSFQDFHISVSHISRRVCS